MTAVTVELKNVLENTLIHLFFPFCFSMSGCKLVIWPLNFLRNFNI